MMAPAGKRRVALPEISLREKLKALELFFVVSCESFLHQVTILCSRREENALNDFQNK